MCCKLGDDADKIGVNVLRSASSVKQKSVVLLLYSTGDGWRLD